MMDIVMAIAALCGLILFLGVLVAFVPETDLVIVVVVVAAMACYDFYRKGLRRRKNDK